MITRARSLLFLAFLALLLPAPAQAGRVKAFDAPMSGAQVFDYDPETKQVVSTVPKLLGVDYSNVVGEWYAGWSSAGDLLDLTGRGRDLADTSSPPIVQASLLGNDGNNLQAYSYDGAADFHSIADADWQDISDGVFTAVALVKSPATNPAGTIVYMSHGQSSADGFYLSMNSSGNYASIFCKAGANAGPLTSTSYADGNWHLVHTVRNASGYATLYVDGVPTAPVDVNTYGIDGARTFYVGAYPGIFWPSYIAYTRLQNSALTYSQIQKEVSFWLGGNAGVGGNRLGAPTFTRSTTSYSERTTGSTPLVQVPANWPAKTSDNGVLIEGAVTQLFTYTGAFSTNWTKFNSSISATSVVLPDGTTGTTNTLSESYVDPENTHYVEQAYSATSGSTYTLSWYVKYNGVAATPREWVRLMISDGVNFYRRYFNVRYGYIGSTDGTLTGSEGVQPQKNGWYRIWIRATAGNTSASALARMYIAEADGDVTFKGVNPSQDSVFIAFPQHQSGAFPTSYYPNPTTGAARAADSLTYIPWRISKDLASKVNATPRLLFLGSESLNGATVTPTVGAYSFTKNGRPQNDDTYAEGPSHRYNGTTDYLSLADGSGGSDFDFSAAGAKFSVTVSYTPLTVAVGPYGIISKWGATANKRQWAIYQSSTAVIFGISKTGSSLSTSITVTGCLEIGKPVLITATYDGTNGDGLSSMRLYVDAATASSPDYIADSDVAAAPLFDSDASFNLAALDVSYSPIKISYAAVYGSTITTLAEHQAMYAAFKQDGVLPLTMSSTTAKTKLVVEFDAKGQYSSTTDIGASRTFLSIGGNTGECASNSNYLNIYAGSSGAYGSSFYGDNDVTNHYAYTSIAPTDSNKWKTHKIVIDLSEVGNSTYTVDGVGVGSYFWGTGVETFKLMDALIRLGQPQTGTPAAHAEFRNVRVSAE